MKILHAICLIFLLSTVVSAIDFRDDALKLNLSYDENQWEVFPNETFRDRLTLRHISYPVTFNVIAYRFNETITANGLVQKRIQSVYDGWELIKQNTIDNFELRKKNLKEGVQSVYKKTTLTEELKNKTVFTGDICYVADDNLGVILNIEIEELKYLGDIKSEYRRLLRSFWVGDQKAMISFVNNKNTEWIMNKQNLSRQRYPVMNHLDVSQLNVDYRQEIQSTVKPDTSVLYNKNGVYLLNNNDLSYVSHFNKEVQYFNVDLFNPEFFLRSDGITMIQKSPKLVVKYYDIGFKLNNQVEIDDSFTHVTPIDEHYLLLMNESTIKLLRDKKVKWEVKHNYDISHFAVENYQLFLTDEKQTQLILLDLETGQIISQLKHINQYVDQFNEPFRFTDIAINSSYVLITLNSGINYHQMLIKRDGNQLLIEDSKMIQAYNYEIKSISSNLIIVKYDDGQGSVLQALDFYTFASVWKIPINKATQSMVLDNQILVIDQDNDLVAYNIKSGTQNKRVVFNEDIVGLKEPYQVKKIFQYKKGLFAVVSKENNQNLIYFR